MANTLKVCASVSQIHVILSRRLGLAVVLSLALSLSLPLCAQTFSVLYKFKGETDGMYPQAGLILDDMGNLYGTTQYGGDLNCYQNSGGCGTVFKIDTHGDETVLYRFAGVPDGAQPIAGLSLDNNGNLYGTTWLGGANNFGTVFKLDSSGRETVLYSFGPYPDGEWPSGGLVMDAVGDIYGTTQQGGSSSSCWGGCGTIFKLDTKGKETVLFNLGPSDEYPTAGVTMDAADNIYGTTSATAFGTRKDLVAPITLHVFTGGAGGEGPHGGVIRDLKGNLYGMTSGGGYSRCPNNPWGTGCGVVYKLSLRGKETVLHTFAGTPEGAIPNAGLLQGRAGILYGTTMFGGSSDFGTVFRLDKRGRMVVLQSFAKTDGALPQSTLIQDAAGNLYGTTCWGGDILCDSKHGCGVVFKLTP